MRRRELIAVIASTAAAWPLLARAQQGERVRRVAVLSITVPTAAEGDAQRKLLREELLKLGWIEGRNLRLDFRFFRTGEIDRIRAAAADLVRLEPDVIFTPAGVTFDAVQQETRTIPIVFVAGDVAKGRVKDIARPEGNATGFASAFSSLGGKWLELLKEAAPSVTRVAFLVTRGGPDIYGPSVEAAARALRVQLFTIPVSDVADMRPAIESFAAEPNGGLILNRGMIGMLPEFIRLAEQYRLPSISGPPSDRALMSYSTDNTQLSRRAVAYVDRILRGAKVSELPVQYPTTYRLIINLKTAKAIGLDVPVNLLAVADEVID
jgi:putative tryptophan/tyrosine transport system substrate-binding protein